jgi:hypothetical protein
MQKGKPRKGKTTQRGNHKEGKTTQKGISRKRENHAKEKNALKNYANFNGDIPKQYNPQFNASSSFSS